MGLDVYVGTLTRYYARAWETVVERTAREEGFDLEVLRPESSPNATTDPTEIEPAIIAWRDGLTAGLGAHLPTRLQWPEGMGPPYFTDKPAWDCYAALLVWAAHDEHPTEPLPPAAPEDWTTDAAVRRSQAEGFRSRYGALMYGSELWLPGSFRFTFGAPDPGGQNVLIGSVSTLQEQLDALNSRTWRADATTIREWRWAGAEHGAPLETSARFGFAVFHELTAAAVQHGLPMKLDY